MEFDKSRIYTAVNADELKIGSKVIVGDSLCNLKKSVKYDEEPHTLECVGDETCEYRFQAKRNGYTHHFGLAYLVEEPKTSKRMTYRQLAEWLAKGNGQVSYSDRSTAITVCVETFNSYFEKKDNIEVPFDYKIRRFGSDEWIEPTIDVYMEDCK